MLETKILELRDKGTFIPIMCTKISGEASGHPQENWLLRRAGFGGSLIQLISFVRKQSTFDPYEWGDRTYQTAHHYISKNWKYIEHGQVIDVEYILKETQDPKESERGL